MAAAPNAPAGSRLAVLLFTDLVGSTQLKSRFGTVLYSRLLARHDELFKQLLAETPRAELLQDLGDGYFASFATVSDAARFALRFQHALRHEPWDPPEAALRTRIGIHCGEVAQLHRVDDQGKPKIVGMAADIAARVMSLAQGGQILMTRGAFDDARQFLSENPAAAAAAAADDDADADADAAAAAPAGDGPPSQHVSLRWIAHGEYLFKGSDAPLEVYELGVEGLAPLTPPPDTGVARRSVSAEQEETLGWRPAVGLPIPQRVGWTLQKKLGEGTFGEVWLARNDRTKQNRVFKFCFDAERLRSFKRELTFFRLLRDALGERRDIARLYDVKLGEPPFFLEGEYAPGGNLMEWAAQTGLAGVPLGERLEIVAKIADAIAAAHGVGVLHKDIKPSNVLIHVDHDGVVHPRLADFGIGLLTDKGQLAARNITEAGFTVLTQNDSSRSVGTRMYSPPEMLTGRPFTTQGDIYALGIMLYQMAVGDLARPLASGWERQVPDELLREDIARCVEGEPQQRLASASELAQRIRTLPQRRARKQFERRRRHAARFVVASLVVLAVLTSLGAIGYVRERRLRQRATAAEENANEQRAVAERERRRAELLLADSMVDSARQLDAAGGVEAAWAGFDNARQQYVKLGLSPLPADLGLLESYDAHPPPLRVIDAHVEPIFAAAVSADGRRAITGSKDRVLKVWEFPSGRELRAITGHNAWIVGVDISPDGRRALTAGATVRLWDLDAGREIRVLGQPGRKPLVVRFLPGDAQRAVSGGEDTFVRLWDLTSGDELRAFGPHNGTVRTVTVTADGKRLLVGSDANGKDALKVWDIESGAALWSGHSPGSRHGIRSLAMFPDGRRAAAANNSGIIEVWDLETHEARALSDRGAVMLAIAVTPDGKSILTGSGDAGVRLLDAETGALRQSFAGATASVRSVDLLAEGRIVMAGSLDGKLRLWDTTAAETIKASFASRAHPQTVFALGTRVTIALADDDPTTTVWDTATAKPLAAVAHDDPLIDRLYPLTNRSRPFVRWNGDLYQAVTTDGTQRVIWQIKADPAIVETALHYWSQKQLLLVREKGFKFGAWDCRTGKRIGEMAGHGARADASFVPDERHVLSLGTDRTLRLWDMRSGAQLYQVQLSSEAHGAIYSPDGRLVATADVGGTIRLWEVASGRSVHVLAGHTRQVTNLRFAPDGRTMISRGDDNVVRIWDVESGRQLHRFVSAAPMVDYEPGGDREFSDMLVVRDLTPGRRELKWWSFPRSVAHREFQPRLAAAAERLKGTAPAEQAAAAAALRTFGEWYAFRGMDAWAAELLEAARQGGESPSPLMLGRCYWKLNRLPDAAREFRRAIELKEAPDEYLRLCLEAIERPPHMPTSLPATTRAVSGAESPSSPTTTAAGVAIAAPSPDQAALERLNAENIQAWILRRDGKLDEAEAVRRRVVEEAGKLLRADDSRMVKYHLGYGELLAQLKRYADAETQYRAAEAGVSALPDDAAQKVDVHQHLARLYVEWEKPAEARRYEAKLAATRPTTAPVAGRAS